VTAGSVSGTVGRIVSSANLILDFILAACDVEGNFMVVKAFQYTNLLSCMLLDAWVSFVLHQNAPLLTVMVEQLGNPIVPVLLLAIHAGEVQMVTANCKRSSLVIRCSAHDLHLSHVRAS
jgi:hypothetical protein